jgi:creatinine amidohydrolase
MGYPILEDKMATMNWPEIERHGLQGTVVLWPSTVLEEHGPHLPITVDLYIGVVLARLVKEWLSGQGIASIVAPPNYWGINNVTAAFPGSFTLRPETLKALLYDTLASLKHWGFERIYLLDLQGENVTTDRLPATRLEKVGQRMVRRARGGARGVQWRPGVDRA